MAKKIKFSLNIDNKSIRNLDDLRENFNINDIIELYKSKILHKWLEVRGYNKELEKINSMDQNNNSQSENKKDELIISDSEDLNHTETIVLKNTIKNILDIFEIEASDIDINDAVYSIIFKEIRKKEFEKFKKIENEHEKIIDNYFQSYDKLRESIIEQSHDTAFLRNAIKEISNKYLNLFSINFDYLYKDFIDKKSIMPIIIILTCNKLRNSLNNKYFSKIYDDIVNYIIPQKQDGFSDIKIFKDGGVKNIENIIVIRSYSIKYNYDSLQITVKEDSKNITYSNRDIDKLIGKKIFAVKIYSNCNDNKLGYVELNHNDIENNNILKHLKSFKGETESYWKDLEPKDKKIMVISIPEGTLIRSQGKVGEELPGKKVNGLFPILDGLDYKSNNKNDYIFYIEV